MNKRFTVEFCECSLLRFEHLCVTAKSCLTFALEYTCKLLERSFQQYHFAINKLSYNRLATVVVFRAVMIHTWT